MISRVLGELSDHSENIFKLSRRKIIIHILYIPNVQNYQYIF